MPRYKLTIEYDGTPFCGWQSQASGRAVQDVVEAGIKGLCGFDVRVNGAGLGLVRIRRSALEYMFDRYDRPGNSWTSHYEEHVGLPCVGR